MADYLRNAVRTSFGDDANFEDNAFDTLFTNEKLWDEAVFYRIEFGQFPTAHIALTLPFSTVRAALFRSTSAATCQTQYTSNSADIQTHNIPASGMLFTEDINPAEGILLSTLGGNAIFDLLIVGT